MKKLLLLLSVVIAGCGGGGSSGTENNTPISAPAALYAAGSLSTEQVACGITPHIYGDVATPNEYKGDFTIPTVTNKLSSDIVRVMDLKDMDPWWAKPITNTCTNRELYLTNIYIENLNRLEKLGVEKIWVYNFGYWDDFSKSVWSIAKDDYTIPDTVMIKIIQEAKKRNIKVYMNWQMNQSDHVHAWESLDTSNTMSKETLIKVLDSYEAHILMQAKFAQSIGLDGIAADLGAFNSDIMKTNLEYRELYVIRISKIIDEIRSVYSGKVVYGQNWDPIIDERIISKIDELRYEIYLANGQLSPDLLNQYAANQIEWFFQRYTKSLNNKYKSVPIEWYIYAQSTQQFYTTGNGYIEDGFCFGICEQKNIKSDFSIQAIAINGALTAINNQTLFKTSGVSIASYWNTDDIIPTKVGGNIVFPNISNSIRNKPAEGIVKSWYKRG